MGRFVEGGYADDFVVGFESGIDARRTLADLKERLAKFGLALHEDKTRLIEFGRFAAVSREKRGERRPETFAFLGFTHYCWRTRDGRFIVKHKTQSNRLTRKLKVVRQGAWRRMHTPLAEQHRWFASILRGHYGYFTPTREFRQHHRWCRDFEEGVWRHGRWVVNTGTACRFDDGWHFM